MASLKQCPDTKLASFDLNLDPISIQGIAVQISIQINVSLEGPLTHFFQIDELAHECANRGRLYLEFLRVPAMSAGVYVLPKGGTDPQKPHHEDEMYYVVRGCARMKVGSEDADVSAGSVIFVEAEVEHRFYNIDEELEVLVFFAPAERE